MEAINNLNHIQTNPIKATINGTMAKNLNQKTMSNEDQFNAAVNVIRRLPKNGPFQPSDEMKLKFYAYYKQATEGPNKTRKPPFYDIVNRYKWDAWNKLADMDKQTAMQLYIDELKKVVETMSFNESVSEFYEVLGPFYEFLPQEVNGDANGETNGSHQMSNDKSESLVENKIKIGKKWTKNSFKDIAQLNGDEDYGVDSEGEEFSDTYDHIEENGDIPIVERNGTEFPIEDIVSFRGGNGSNPSAQMSSSNQSVNRSVSSNRNRNIRESGLPSTHDNTAVHIRSDGGSGGSGQGFNPQEYSIGINEQLALAVIRLQQSMDQVVNRLDTLESMLSRESRVRSETSNSSRLWPFQEMRPQTALLLMVWPFVAHWIFDYVRNKKKRSSN